MFYVPYFCKIIKFTLNISITCLHSHKQFIFQNEYFPNEFESFSQYCWAFLSVPYHLVFLKDHVSRQISFSYLLTISYFLHVKISIALCTVANISVAKVFSIFLFPLFPTFWCFPLIYRPISKSYSHFAFNNICSNCYYIYEI